MKPYRIRFLGKLVHFAQYLAQNKVRIQHIGEFNHDSFVDNLPAQSILDVIGFSPEANAHFERRRTSYFDQAHDNPINEENTLIQNRIEKRKLGQRLNREIDNNFRRQRMGCSQRS